MGNVLFNISKLINNCIEDCTKEDVTSMYQYYRYDDNFNFIELEHDNRLVYYSFKQGKKLSPIQETSENTTSSSSISPMSSNSSPCKSVDGYNSPYLTKKNTMYFIKK